VAPVSLTPVTIDVTDATFPTDVLERSTTTPVVVDLWAEWCGPCKTLGPILEQVIDETGGQVVLAKLDVDANPQTAQAFRVQSIPAVYAVVDGKVVDGFVGAQPEEAVREFVARLLPTQEQTEVDRLRELGDEASLRAALELEPDNEGAIVDLAELLVGDDRGEEALELLARIPESSDTRRVAALARSGGGFASEDDIERRLGELIDEVKDDDAARQEYIDLLEILGPDDPRTGTYRRQLTSRLF
jgi:putative thioredoxin